MATVTVANTTANLSGKTITLAERDHTITGAWSFSRSPSSPFIVASGSAKVSNLDADKLDGQEGPSSDIVGISDSQTLTNKTLTSPVITGATITSSTFDVSSRIPYSPDWGNAGTVNDIGDGVLGGEYIQIGDFVHFNIILTYGSTSSVGSAGMTFTTPTAIQGGFSYGTINGGAILYDASGGAYRRANFLVTNAASGIFSLVDDSTPLSGVTATAPFTWANGDQISISGAYLVA